MDACLETGVDYLDTANYEPPDVAKFEYKWQWAYQERFKDKGLMALLGCGFDPGRDQRLLRLRPEAPLRRDPRSSTSSTATPATTAIPLPPTSTRRSTSARSPRRGRYWENGQWIEIDPLILDDEASLRLSRRSARRTATCCTTRRLESLVKHIQGLKRIRFWMTFSDNYLTHCGCCRTSA